jgi:hypothetical protein
LGTPGNDDLVPTCSPLFVHSLTRTDDPRITYLAGLRFVR